MVDTNFKEHFSKATPERCRTLKKINFSFYPRFFPSWTSMWNVEDPSCCCTNIGAIEVIVQQICKDLF